MADIDAIKSNIMANLSHIDENTNILNTKITSMRDKNSALLERLKSINQGILQLNAHRSALITQLRQLEEEIRESNEKLAQTETRLNESMGNEGRIGELQQDKAELEQEKAALQGEKDDLIAFLNEINGRVVVVNNSIQQLAEDNDSFDNPEIAKQLQAIETAIMANPSVEPPVSENTPNTLHNPQPTGGRRYRRSRSRGRGRGRRTKKCRKCKKTHKKRRNCGVKASSRR
jgi:predicted  nucleic acid-binding Zn-ribbon protein